MKKKKNFALMLAFTALLGLTACSKEEIQSNEADLNMAEVTLKATTTTRIPLNYTSGISLSIYDGTSSVNPFWKSTDYIEVDRPGSAPYVAIYGVTENSGGQIICWYDINKHFIKADASKFTSEFVTPLNAAFFRVSQHTEYEDVPLSILCYAPLEDKEIVSLSYTESIYLDYYTGVESPNNFWKCSQAINVQPGDVYYVKDNEGGQVLFWYSVSGRFIKTDESKVQTTFEAPADAAFFKVNQHGSYPDVTLYKMLPAKNMIQAYLFCRSIEDDGTISENENCNWKYSTLIPIDINTQYHLPNSIGGQTVFWYDNSVVPQFVSKVEAISATTVLTPPANAAYIRILQHIEYPDAPLYKYQ